MAVPAVVAAVLRSNPYLAETPLLLPADDIPKKAKELGVYLQGDFCWTPIFEPEFVARLMHSGFLPIATTVRGAQNVVLLPKLHARRCCLPLDKFHAQRRSKRESRPYRFSVDRAFNAVIDGCVQQHGRNWLYPQVVECLKGIFKNKALAVQMHSVELWKDGHLVAGELGYSCGSVYTSMTGFFRVPGAGSVQLNCLGKLLCRSGFTLWDLGMYIEYKASFGALQLPRLVFLQRLAQSREPRVLESELVDAVTLFPPKACNAAPNPNSKRQLKRKAKKERKAALKQSKQSAAPAAPAAAAVAQ